MFRLAALLLLATVTMAADIAATEAALNATPEDYRAWSNHAAALIEAGTTQTGEQQKTTFKLALQCAQKGQELCIAKAQSPSVIINRGDDLCLGVLGMAQAMNGQEQAAIDSLTKAIAAISSKQPASITDLQHKAQIEAFRDQIMAAQANAQGQAAVNAAAAATMPVVVWRDAAWGSTKVAKIGNPHTAPVVLTLTHMRGATTLHANRLDLAPQEVREVGHREGFPFASGDSLVITRVDSGARITVQVP